MTCRIFARSLRPSLAVAILFSCAVLNGSAQELVATKTLEEVKALQGRVQKVAQKVLPATVALQVGNTGASGSGVVVNKEGLILTAAHVVEGSEKVMVIFPNGRRLPGKVLGANATRDEAMVQIEGPGPFPFALVGDSDTLKAGTWVIALGHSAGFDPARTPPVRFGRVISINPGNFMTTSCTLIGGDSGGPLFDLDGRVVAIHSSISQSLQSNNHTRIAGFKDDWKRMLAGETWGRLTMNPMADPESPVIGIEFAPGSGPGVLVKRVVPAGPADNSGILAGDRVLAVDGQVVRDTRALLIVLGSKAPGNQVEVTFQRSGKDQKVKVQLARRGDMFKE
jgi:serine protease Do